MKVGINWDLISEEIEETPSIHKVEGANPLQPLTLFT